MDDVHSINVGLLLDVDDYNSTTFHVGDWNSSPEQGWVIASWTVKSGLQFQQNQWTMKSGFQFQQNQIFYVVFVPKGESPMQAILDDENVQIDAHRVSPVVYRSKIAADIQVNMLRIARDLHEDLWEKTSRGSRH